MGSNESYPMGFCRSAKLIRVGDSVSTSSTNISEERRIQKYLYQIPTGYRQQNKDKCCQCAGDCSHPEVVGLFFGRFFNLFPNRIASGDQTLSFGGCCRTVLDRWIIAFDKTLQQCRVCAQQSSLFEPMSDPFVLAFAVPWIFCKKVYTSWFDINKYWFFLENNLG